MNFQETSLNKTSDTQICSKCFNKGLFISARHVSWIVSILLLLCFFIFMAGYFLGQKKVLTTFSEKVDEDALADQIYSSMLGMYDIEKNLVVQNIEQQSMPDSVENELPEDQEAQLAEIGAGKLDEPEITVQQGINPDIPVVNPNSFYAKLIGFGTHRAAQKFANRLQKRDLPIKINKRSSKTASGKVISWYQVVTESFTNKEELNVLVDTIKKTEKLHDVRIVSC